MSTLFESDSPSGQHARTRAEFDEWGPSSTAPAHRSAAGLWLAGRSPAHSTAYALGLQRLLGLRSYQTAWAWLHRFRRAMVRPADLEDGDRSDRRRAESRKDRQSQAPLGARPVAFESHGSPRGGSVTGKLGQHRRVVRLRGPCQPKRGNSPDDYISRRVQPERTGGRRPCRALKKRIYWVKNCANFHSNREQFCDGCRALLVSIPLLL